MIATPVLPRVEPVPFNEVLADAVILSWNDLMPAPSSGLIHIEYHLESLGSVEFMKIWASTIRGEWNLVCDHWTRANGSRESGLRFAGGYKSTGLEQAITSIMQHQESFLPSRAAGSDHMIQVAPPTDADKVAASEAMDLFS